MNARKPPAADAAHDTDRAGGIQVIARAASVLRALQQHPSGLTLGELAKLIGLPRSTIQRIVDALAQEQLVMAASPERGVRLGPALLSLARAARFEVAEFARPTLMEIARTCGETVDLSIFNGDQLVFVDQVAGVQRLKAESGVGVAFPLHCTAPGKAMLALLNSTELHALKARLPLTRQTPNTITQWSELESTLTRVRRQGVAVDMEEHALGICALACGLRLPSNGFAAVSIPVPTQRFAASKADLKKLLLTSCQRLQDSLTPALA